LFNRIKKSSSTAANIKKLQFALVPTSEDFAELRQCLPPDGIGCAVKEYFDLGVIPSAESSVIQPPD
jgi:hypothetical protein